MYIRNSSNVCKTIDGIGASQLYPFSMYQEMLTELYTRWDYDSETHRFKARNNRTRTFENMVTPFYQELRPECKFESFYTTESRRKLTVSTLMATAISVKQYLKLWVANIFSSHAKEPVHLYQNKILKGTKEARNE